MSKLSIYENSWLDLVFEGRNKEYGAYQLRQQNPKTTLKALFFGTLICGSLLSIPVISGLLDDKKVNPVATNDQPLDGFIDVVIPVKLLPEEPKIIPDAKKSEPEKSSQKQVKNVIPKITDNTKPISETPILDFEKPIKTGEVDNIGDDKGNIALGSNISTDGKGTKTSEGDIGIDDGNIVYPDANLEASPSFPGGIKNFLELVGKKFRTPDDIESGGKMQVFVYFVVEKDGSLSNIKVTRDPGYGLGNEAIRVLKSIKTKWSPGIQNNKPVRTAFNLPISVKIN